MALVGAQFVNAVSPNPVGSLQAYAGASAPTGWLLCDGTSYSTSVYPELFSVLGYTYGGSGANFNVPDLRGRMPMGAGTGAKDGASGTGVISGGTALTARSRGSYGGAQSAQTAWGSAVWAQDWSWSSGSSPATRQVGNPGNTPGDSNMPPFLVTNYIIKAFPDAPRSGLAYGSTPPIVTALPANPQFGDVVTYIADATNGVAWNLQYDATGTYPWKFIGGSGIYSANGNYPASQGTTSYADLTNGATVTAPLAGDYQVFYSGKVDGSNPTVGALNNVAVATATIAASDTKSYGVGWQYTFTGTVRNAFSHTTVMSGVAKNEVVKMQVKQAVGTVAAVYHYTQMLVTPVRVSA